MLWDFATVPVSATALGMAVYARGLVVLWDRAGAGRGITYGQAACFLSGAGVLALTLASPLHDATGRLFSMHMLQHLLLVMVAAPLLAWGIPGLVLTWAVPGRGRRFLMFCGRRVGASLAGRWAAHPGLILGLYVGVIWFWHLPQPYQAAAGNGVIHHLEHGLLLAAAGAYWWRVAAWTRGPLIQQGLAIIYLFSGMLAGGALGAFLLLAGNPLYQAHSGPAPGWGLDPMSDQQVGALMMLMPAGLAHFGLIIALFLHILGGGDQREARLNHRVPGNTGLGKSRRSGEHNVDEAIERYLWVGR